ncbi:MAG: cysteine rich repeat-containing protein [Smithella sp.]
MKTLRLALSAAIMFCFVSSLCYAQDINRKGSCRADIKKFCKDIKPDHGQIAQCIKRHETELSSACEYYIDTEKEKAQDFIKACKPDAGIFCKDMKPGHGRIARCLKQHRAELSADCGGFFKK